MSLIEDYLPFPLFAIKGTLTIELKLTAVAANSFGIIPKDAGAGVGQWKLSNCQIVEHHAIVPQDHVTSMFQDMQSGSGIRYMMSRVDNDRRPEVPSHFSYNISTSSSILKKTYLMFTNPKRPADASQYIQFGADDTSHKDNSALARVIP